MLKISYAGCLGLSLAILVQSTFKMCVAGRNRKNSPKNLFWEFKVVQGHWCWQI